MQGPCRTQSKIWDFILCGMGISWRAWAVDLTWLRSRFRRVPLASMWRSGSARLVVISRDEVWESVSPLHMNLQVANFPRCKLHSVNVSPGWHRSLPSTSALGGIAACLPSPITGCPPALPSPTSSSSSSLWPFLPVRWMPAPVCQLLHCTIQGPEPSD